MTRWPAGTPGGAPGISVREGGAWRDVATAYRVIDADIDEERRSWAITEQGLVSDALLSVGPGRPVPVLDALLAAPVRALHAAGQWLSIVQRKRLKIPDFASKPDLRQRYAWYPAYGRK